MKSRYQYRIYPTPAQKQHLAKLFGCCRVVFNDALAICKKEQLYKDSELQKRCITQAKKTPERAWLSEVSVVPLQQAIRDLKTALNNFFDSKKGKRKSARRIGFPRFKTKRSRQTARFTQRGFSIPDGVHKGVYLAKIGTLKTKWSRPLPCPPSSVTVIKDCAGRYFLSCVVQTEPVDIPAEHEAVGVDLGIHTFAALSNQQKIKAPDDQTFERRIRRAKRRLSKSQKGSRRRERARLVVAKLRAKVKDIRHDFLHQLSTDLVKRHQRICLEDLDISNMLQNKRLARVISQSGFYEFRRLCLSKGQKFQREVEVIDRYQPTSQSCADCGYRWGKLDLSQRTVVCLGCLKTQDRDLNAAKNIEYAGAGPAKAKNGRGSARQTPIGARRDEPSTRVGPKQLRLL